MLGNKLVFRALLTKAFLDGQAYTFIRFLEPPVQLMLDKVPEFPLFLCSFSLCSGMGLNLTLNDF